MSRRARSAHARLTLEEQFPASQPCSCAVCRSYCARPGWWTAAQAAAALEAGLGPRMMLEFSPDQRFAVLAPALRGCEAASASNLYAGNGCTFLHDDHCELHGAPYMPLECRFCHHDRPGQGLRCHAALEQDWQTPAGQALAAAWLRQSAGWPLSLEKRLRLARLRAALLPTR